MKNLIAFISCLLSAVFLLNSCSNLITNRLNILNIETENECKYTEQLIDTIINSINEKDFDGIKNAFSENAIEVSKELDDDIELLFDFIPEEITQRSDNYSPYTSESSSGGKKTKKCRLYYEVSVSDVVYTMLFIYCIRDDTDPKNEGLNTLAVTRGTNRERFKSVGALGIDVLGKTDASVKF